jgi:hypothetical protein
MPRHRRAILQCPLRTICGGTLCCNTASHRTVPRRVPAVEEVHAESELPRPPPRSGSRDPQWPCGVAMHPRAQTRATFKLLARTTMYYLGCTYSSCRQGSLPSSALSPGGQNRIKHENRTEKDRTGQQKKNDRKSRLEKMKMCWYLVCLARIIEALRQCPPTNARSCYHVTIQGSI